MSKRFLVWWGYTVELIAAAVVLLCLGLWFGSAEIVSFLRNAAIDIATLFSAVMFAASLGFLWSFYTKADTDFYRWLESKGAFAVYLHAAGFAVAVSFASTVTLVFLRHVDTVYFGLVTIYLLLLAVINLYSLVANVMGLMRLNAQFNHGKRDN